MQIHVRSILHRQLARSSSGCSGGGCVYAAEWYWCTLQEGLDSISVTRHVSVICIVLSTVPLSTKEPGYQPPLPPEMVKVHISPSDYLQQPTAAQASNFRCTNNMQRALFGRHCMPGDKTTCVILSFILPPGPIFVTFRDINWGPFRMVFPPTGSSNSSNRKGLQASPSGTTPLCSGPPIGDFIFLRLQLSGVRMSDLLNT